MDSNELIEKLASPMGKASVVQLSTMLAEDNFDIAQLINITFHFDRTIGFRAAWLLENVYLHNQDNFVPHIPLLIGRFKDVKNPSCQRHYAKILMQLTDRRAPKNIKAKINETDLAPVIEQCFDWLIDSEILVAVKVHAAEVLFNLRMRYPWISDELTEQLHFLMRDGTMAIQTRGKRLLSQLEPVK